VRDSVYRTVDGQALALDALIPGTPGPHPAVLLMHGGAWMFGAKEDMRVIAEALCEQGFAAVSIDYRLAPKHHYPAQIEDCIAAVQYLRAHADELSIDPRRIAALGPSAGGHLASMLGVLDERADPDADDPNLRVSTRVQAVVSYFGPTLLTREQSLDFDTLPPKELFSSDASDSDYRAASPIEHASADDPPFLFVHGTEDSNVPVQHSEILHERLSELGVTNELFLVEGGGHGDFLERNPRAEHWERVLAFLRAHLPAPARSADK
jgi:acetyl esterase/lipase